MSLKGIESRMLGIANKHGEHRKTEPGTDPGIFAGQPGGAVRGNATQRDLRVDDPHDLLSRILEAEAHNEGSAAAIYRDDYGVEPGPGDQVDRSIQRRWSGTGARLWAEPVRKALHGGRY